MVASRSRKSIALALCLAACSSPPPSATQGEVDQARDADVSVAAATPPRSFRASLDGTDASLAVSACTTGVARQLSAARRNVAPPGYPKRGDAVLVDIASYDDAQVLIERVNVSGVLQSRAGDMWWVRDGRTQKRVGIRLEQSSWSRAPKGAYRLQRTGEVVGQPAYHVHMKRYASLPATGCVVGAAP